MLQATALPSGGSGFPSPGTSQVVPGIRMSVSLGDHYFTCHMVLGALAECQV